MKKFLVKTLLLGFISVLSVSAYAQNQSSANLQKIELSEVKILEVNGKFKINLIQGTKEEAELDAPAEVLSKITMKQSGKKLTLSVKDKDSRAHAPFTVNIILKDPEQISLQGLAQVEVQGIFACKKMNLQLADKVSFQGELRTSESINIKMSGHASLEASLTAIKPSKIELSDYATAELKGHVPSVSLTQSGSSKLGSRAFSTNTVTAKMSNMTTAELTVNKSLSATTEDSAVLHYGGVPKTKVSCSGVSKVVAL